MTNSYPVNWVSGVMNVKSYTNTNSTISSGYHIKKEQKTESGNTYYKVYLELDKPGDWNYDGNVTLEDLTWYRKYLAGDNDAKTSYTNHQNKSILDYNSNNSVDLYKSDSYWSQFANYITGF